MPQKKILDHVASTELILEKQADQDREHIPEILRFLREMILLKRFDHQ